jgi:hypothetical protein
MATEALPISLIPRLLLAGWTPHRDVWDRLELPATPTPFPEAKRILSRFGRLRFGNTNEQLVLEPLTATEHDPDLLRRCEDAVGRRLYPLGYQEHQDREPIFVDEDGAIYLNFGDDLHLLGKSFESSLRYLAHPGGTARDFRAVLRTAGIKPNKWTVGDPAAP